ncbi:MAG: deoxyribonuclease-1 [Salibacteraceae bacterium]|jgi:deoxyribonuclease-1
MMKKNIFSIIFLLPFMIFGQSIDFSAKYFDFQTVIDTDSDSIQLTLTNNSGYDISVTGIKFMQIYDAQPFFVKDSVFSISIGNAYDIWVYFEPEQNILHQMKAVVKTDFRGDYLISLKGIGNFSNSYYDNSYNKIEQDLKASLKTITGQGYNSLSYSGARDNMYGSIDNVGGDVECVYTGRVATFNTRPGANSNSFNCEHTFPQGFFNQSSPMRSDIHHLFSTDVTSNSRRGNYPFGIVSGSSSWSVGGSKQGGGVFEPRDAQKGQVARALFYFVLRYEDYSSHVQGQETILRTWFDQYPPIAKDIDRNNDIYALQNNRNPFVDYPQLLKRISKISGNSVATGVKGLYVSRDTVDMTGQTDSTLYTISIMNTGNEKVTITNFRISNTTNFDFSSAQSDITLLPGEGYEIQLRVTPTLTPLVDETLSFDTDVSGMGTVDVTLLGGWSTLSTAEVDGSSKLRVFPNPAKSAVSVVWQNQKNYDLEIYNVVGKLVYSSGSLEQKQINVSDFESGSYILKTSNGSLREQTTLIIK